MSEASEKKGGGVPLASVALLVIAVVAAVGLIGRARQPRLPRPERAASNDPLLLVPPGPRLLISADVASLMAVAASDLARLGGDQLLGLRQTCGFEPMLSLRRAVFAMPFGGGDFALIADTSIEQERGLRCAELVIQKRGGSAGRAKLGAFTSVRDLSKPLGEVAMRSDGLFVLSGGAYFREVMDAASGTVKVDEAGKLRTRLHRSVRDKLGPAQLELTLLPEASSVLRGVVAVGLALQIQSDVALRGLVACVSAPACSQAREVIESTKTELAREPGLSGLASLRVDERGDRLELSARLPREQLGPLLAQLVTP
jgi:hypothetical protein